MVLSAQTTNNGNRLTTATLRDGVGKGAASREDNGLIVEG